jgi:ERCC4-related helicase
MLQGKIVFCAPTKPLLNQQVTACYNKMSVSKVQSSHNALLIAGCPHFRPTRYTLASGIAFWHEAWQ